VAATEQTATPEVSDFQRWALYDWRYAEARKAGLDAMEAQTFAVSTVDIGELRRLHAAGCPPALIARLIL